MTVFMVKTHSEYIIWVLNSELTYEITIGHEFSLQTKQRYTPVTGTWVSSYERRDQIFHPQTWHIDSDCVRAKALLAMLRVAAKSPRAEKTVLDLIDICYKTRDDLYPV